MNLNDIAQAVKTILGARMMRALATPQVGSFGITQRFNRERAALRAAKKLAGGPRQWKRKRVLARLATQAAIGR